MSGSKFSQPAPAQELEVKATILKKRYRRLASQEDPETLYHKTAILRSPVTRYRRLAYQKSVEAQPCLTEGEAIKSPYARIQSALSKPERPEIDHRIKKKWDQNPWLVSVLLNSVASQSLAESTRKKLKRSSVPLTSFQPLQVPPALRHLQLEVEEQEAKQHKAFHFDRQRKLSKGKDAKSILQFEAPISSKSSLFQYKMSLK